MNDGFQDEDGRDDGPLQREAALSFPPSSGWRSSSLKGPGPRPTPQGFACTLAGRPPPRSGFSASSIQLAGDLATVAGVHRLWLVALLDRCTGR